MEKTIELGQAFDVCLNVAAGIVEASKAYWTPNGTPVFCGGDPPAPTAVESTREMLRGYEEGLPGFLRVTREEAVPTAEAAYELTKKLAPLYSALQTQIYGDQGRELNRIGREIARENALAQAATDVEVLKGAGRDVVREAAAAQREVDPEYYATRETVARGLAELLSGKLTGGEEEAMSRYLNREAVNTGVTAKNALQTAAAATRFGEAAHNKLAQALALATGAMPVMRSGVDVMMQTVGRPSNNAGDARFLGVTPEAYGNQAYQFGNNLLGQIGENQRMAMQINANRRDTMDRVHQGTEIAKNIVSSVGSLAMGMCYILTTAVDFRLPLHTYAWIQSELTPQQKLGYVKMAEWLVPAMSDKTIKALIRKLVAEPWIRKSFGTDSWLDNLLTKLSGAVWSIYGRI